MSDPENPQTGHDGGTNQARVTYVTTPVCARDPERPQTGRDGGTDQANNTYVHTSHPESPQSIHHENENETETGSDGTDRPPHFFIDPKNSNDPDCTALMEVSPLNPVDPNDESDYRNREAVTDNNDEKGKTEVRCWRFRDNLSNALARRKERISSMLVAPPGPLDILIYIVNMVSFGFDIWTDVNLAYTYYADGHTWWFGLTVLFIVLMALFSFGLHLTKESMFRGLLSEEGFKICRFQWFLRIIFSMLMLGPFFMTCEVLYDALRINWWLLKKDSKGSDHVKLKRFDFDAWVMSLLCFMEAFIEAGPQLVLQLCALETIGWKEDNTQLGIRQLLSIISSIWVLSWSLVRFKGVINTQVNYRKDLGCVQSIIKLLNENFFVSMWRLCTISGRVLALSMFAACFPYYVAPVCLVHFILMAIWVYQIPLYYGIFRFVTNPKVLKVYTILMAYVYVFDYHNVIGRVRLRAVLYYSIIYVENCVLICLWHIRGQCSKMGSLGNSIVLFIVIVGFWFGMAFMGIHYMCCHRHRENIKCCVPRSELRLCSRGTFRYYI